MWRPALAAAVLAATSTSAYAADKPIFSRYEIRLGGEAGGPVLFRDTPDQVLEDTSAFEFGGNASFLFGVVGEDFDRFGLAVGYAGVARSPSRHLKEITPRVVFETGGTLNLQAGLGYAITTGTDGFKQNYGGVYSRLGIRRTFVDPDSDGPMGVSIGLYSDFTASTKAMQYSSAFVGAEFEIVYHSKVK